MQTPSRESIAASSRSEPRHEVSTSAWAILAERMLRCLHHYDLSLQIKSTSMTSSQDLTDRPGDNLSVTPDERAARDGQTGLVVWFTGLSGAGQTTLAVSVELPLCALCAPLRVETLPSLFQRNKRCTQAYAWSQAGQDQAVAGIRGSRGAPGASARRRGGNGAGDARGLRTETRKDLRWRIKGGYRYRGRITAREARPETQAVE